MRLKSRPRQDRGEQCRATSASAPLPASLLEALARYDAPTICNAMEIVAPERRLTGYTTKPLVCPFPDLPPIVGYARTVTMRLVLASGLAAANSRSAGPPITNMSAPAMVRASARYRISTAPMSDTARLW